MGLVLLAAVLLAGGVSAAAPRKLAYAHDRATLASRHKSAGEVNDPVESRTKEDARSLLGSRSLRTGSGPHDRPGHRSHPVVQREKNVAGQATTHRAYAGNAQKSHRKHESYSGDEGDGNHDEQGQHGGHGGHGGHDS